MFSLRTRLLLVACVVLAVFIPATAGGQSEPPQQITPVGVSEPQKRCFVTQKTHRRYVRAVYSRKTVSERSLKRLDKLRRCAASPKAAHNMLRLQRSEGQARRVRLRADRCTSYGEWAIPAYIVMKESGGRIDARNKDSTAGGYYQFIDSTWFAYGGKDYHDPNPVGGFQHPAAMAPAHEQHCVAHRAWAGGAGSSHWALTR